MCIVTSNLVLKQFLIILLLQNNTSVDAVVPPKADLPRLITIGNIKKDATLFSFVVGIAIFMENIQLKLF